MKIKQISVFMENKTGRLGAVLNMLKEKEINVRAISVADTTGYGIVRLIVDDTEKAYNFLKANDYAVTVTEVLAVSIDDRPGSLSAVLEVLSSNNIDVEYMYTCLKNKENTAYIIFRVDNLEKATEAFISAGVEQYDEKILG